jgi:Resolvase, N terminal domain
LSQKVERSLFEATICFVGKVDRLSRDLRHLVNTVLDLTARGIGFKVLTGHGASIDTTFPGGKLVFGIVAALAEFERELIIERTKAGMAAARARGRNGGRPYKMAPSKLRLAVASMNQPETRIGDLCAELGITLRMRQVDPTDARYAERFPLRENTESGRQDTVRTFSGRRPWMGCRIAWTFVRQKARSTMTLGRPNAFPCRLRVSLGAR